MIAFFVGVASLVGGLGAFTRCVATLVSLPESIEAERRSATMAEHC